MVFKIVLKNGDEMTADQPNKAAMMAWLEECGYMRAKRVYSGSIDRNKGNAVRQWYPVDEAVSPSEARL